MEKQQDLPFPYEFRELNPEEDKLVKANLGAFPTTYVKLGPKGYMVYRPYLKDAANIYNMPLRPTDVFVASYQRSGTTMTQELVWLIENDLNFEAAKTYMSLRYIYLDGFMIYDPEKQEEYNDILPNPENLDMERYLGLLEYSSRPGSSLLAAVPPTEKRFVKTHLPLSLMPPNMLDTVKMVYLARDPRDVAVSSFHHARLLYLLNKQSNFKDFWEMFHRGLYTLTPYFEHVKEAWAKRHDPNMLFLFYEDYLKDLPGCIARIADFLGKKLSEEQIQRLCEHLNFEKFKNNGAVNMEDYREIGILADGEHFIRKGKAGCWRDYFDEEMTKQAEKWIKDNLKDTDLRYPNMEL
uniref:RETINOL DEHYDRATASE n=1 Tax=Spodoptera frugiperda TaxID=7108 RepID=UPI00001116E7|nr:Chain A, RETINOL DEHYDRATASE [Spodoptera frugiperda]1FMJ_B Chain B, RETINOL DEHYDRATASE [Spodoptera frugiperda]1FML_A Chain A, RETINOL DEHYDRATASE [Spodoptera frugiperda]1FML_B Chain B, RETINOL DEHYDRATASE [Spodoptera frugiperda]